MQQFKYVCTVTACGNSVNIKSDTPVYERLHSASFLYRHTGLTVSPGAADTPCELQYVDCKARELDFGNEVAKVWFPWTEMAGGEVLLFLAYPYIEVQNQKQGFVTAHAACVEMPNGKAVLLFGKEGQGKTSIALRLCQAGGKLVGNDLVVIGLDEGGGLVAKTGSQFFFLRYKSIQRALPDLLHVFPHRAADTWLQKRVVMPSELGFEVSTQQAVIAAAYLVHVDNDQERSFSQHMDNLNVRLYLNENFSRYIRSTCTTLMTGEKFDFVGYIPPLDKREFYERRVQLMKFLLEELGIGYVSGPLREIVAKIIRDNT